MQVHGPEPRAVGVAVGAGTAFGNSNMLNIRTAATPTPAPCQGMIKLPHFWCITTRQDVLFDVSCTHEGK